MPRTQALTMNQILEEAFSAHDQGARADAEKGYLQVLKLDQANAAVWYGMGRLAMEATDFEEGVIRFNRAIALGFTQPMAFVRLGWCLQALGRFTQALVVLRDAESLAPGDPAQPVNLAVVHGQMGDWSQALDCAKRSIALRETFVPAHLNAGAALVNLGREEEALSHFLRVLELEPENPEAKANAAALRG